MMDEHDKAHFQTVEAAMDFGGEIGAVGVVAAFNLCADHVARLLEDAIACHRLGSFGTAVFLAVTALEETAKAELLILRSRKPQQKKGRDPLRDHRSKHHIAVRATTFMGRLPSILGEEACVRLRSEAEGGGFAQLREAALYVHADKSGLRSPASEISKQRSRELSLLALESADDILVGGTNHSYVLGERFEALIAELS